MKPYYYATEPNSLRKWETLEEAQAEAERYAENHPGKSFEILRCVGRSSTSKASTFWVDGDEPPEKPRYRMLEEGEPIADGDEFSRGYQWATSQCAGQKYNSVMHQPHRRPL